MSLGEHAAADSSQSLFFAVISMLPAKEEAVGKVTVKTWKKIHTFELVRDV